ncbi:hypothetical protein TOPH_06515 [Tolypocladium ophioglossoides CBS 100239]|uniref:Zn(2)-C6 fungal-type domain-containing protein n=1 Tax=Tolypocladium ophioglossoides (strain CBS 100239) TaxID=1163406 RepID=A0A0L0N4P0_TOLOC|nr:hypothetical protein TOPH_06515 [Tolypocladium ophioglossoides CBS 100239]
MASRHPLRRSCAFCRARKIKCSNETICEACRRQGADCIYDFEPPRPKARTISQDRSRLDPAPHNGAPGIHRQRSSTGGSPNGSPVGAIAEENAPMEDVENLAQALEQRFYENFSPNVEPRSSPWQERMSAYHRSVQSSVRGRNEGLTAQFSPKNVKYTGILSLLTRDLVGLVTDQFGSLGCHHVEDGSARFFLSGLDGDETQTMFDSAPSGSNPLSEYGQRQQTQLIDVWFSAHPLSFLVYKTLLLRELRDGTYDEILLAAILTEANFSIGDEVAVARGHVLLRWATAQLRTRPLRPCHQPQNGGTPGDASDRMYSGISTRIFSGISTAQALVLLGWSALCAFQIRRATCYIGLAGRIATEIKEQISSTAAPMTSTRINGIDVFDVEKELVAYLYWTTYSLSLWADIQMGIEMGNGRFSALLPISPTSILLPVTEASSVIIQLDLVSENFSTLQKQKAVMREMWPLAHIASVIAYILALYAQDKEPGDSPTTSFWQEAPLLALQRTQQGKPSPDIACVCREINRVLMESIHILNRQVTEVSSRSLVLLVYHTMAIHFLFPILPPAGQGDGGIAADVVERFCASAQEVLHIFALILDQPQDLFRTTPSLRSSFPDVFCLALDTCARALSFIDGKRRRGGLLMELPMVQAYEDRLQSLANRLYTTCQNDFLNQGRSLRMVRKHLKTCVRASSGSRPESNYDSSGVPSPDSNHARGASMPMPHSPLHHAHSRSHSHSHSPSLSPPAVMPASASESGRMSAATTAVVDSTLTPSLQSSLPSPDSSGRSSTNRFSPVDKLFHHVLDPGAQGAAAGEHLSVSDLVGLQHAWFPQMPNVMDFDISGPMSGSQWDWPEVGGADATTTTAAAAFDMDSVLYYFENGHNKRPC